MGKILKRNEACRVAAQVASRKKSNGIVKGRVRQRKNSLELNIDLDFEAMDYLVTKTHARRAYDLHSIIWHRIL